MLFSFLLASFLHIWKEVFQEILVFCQTSCLIDDFLVPLFEGLCSSNPCRFANPCRFDFSVFVGACSNLIDEK